MCEVGVGLMAGDTLFLSFLPPIQVRLAREGGIPTDSPSSDGSGFVPPPPVGRIPE